MPVLDYDPYHADPLDLEDENQSDFLTGVKHGAKSTYATGLGAVGLLGDTLGSDRIRDFGLGQYQSTMESMQEDSRDQYTYEGVNTFGDAADFAQYWLGYGASQIATGIGSGALGAAVAKRALKETIEVGVKRYVADKAAKGKIRDAAEERIASDLIRSELTNKYAQRGFLGGMAPQAFAQELGATYGEAVERAEREGVHIDDVDLARVWGYGTAAFATEFATDILTAGALKVGPAKRAFDKVTSTGPVAGRAQRGLAVSQAEGLTEVTQTGLEEMGAGASFDEANFSDPTSYFAGMIPGGAVGLARGNTGPVEKVETADLLDRAVGQHRMDQTAPGATVDMFGGQPGDPQGPNAPIQEPETRGLYDPRTEVGPQPYNSQMELGSLDPRRDEEAAMFAANEAERLNAESRAYEGYQRHIDDTRARQAAQQAADEHVRDSMYRQQPAPVGLATQNINEGTEPTQTTVDRQTGVSERARSVKEAREAMIAATAEPSGQMRLDERQRELPMDEAQRTEQIATGEISPPAMSESDQKWYDKKVQDKTLEELDELGEKTVSPKRRAIIAQAMESAPSTEAVITQAKETIADNIAAIQERENKLTTRKDLKLSGQQQQVFDVMSAAAQDGTLDEYMDADGTLNYPKLAAAAKLPVTGKGKTKDKAKTAVLRTMDKIAKAMGTDTETLKAQLRATKVVRPKQTAIATADDTLPGETIDDTVEAFGPEGQQNMGIITSPGGSQSAVGEGEIQSEQETNAERNAQSVEDIAQHEESLDRILENANLPLMEQAWEHVRAEEITDFNGLSKQDKVEFINITVALQSGEYTPAEFRNDLEQIENRYYGEAQQSDQLESPAEKPADTTTGRDGGTEKTEKGGRSKLTLKKPVYRRETDGKQSTVERVERWLKGPINKLGSWVQTEVVQSVADLKGGPHPPDVAGAIIDGKIYLVADNIGTRAEARTTLAHEAVGHVGLEQIMGKAGFENLLEAITGLKKNKDKRINAMATKIRKNYLNVKGEYALDERTEAREILAHLAEENPAHGLVRRATNKIRQWLLKLGIGDQTAVSLEAMLIDAARLTQAELGTGEAQVLTENAFKKLGELTAGNMWAEVAKQSEAFKWPISKAKSWKSLMQELAGTDILVQKGTAKQMQEKLGFYQQSGEMKGKKVIKVTPAMIRIGPTSGRGFDIVETENEVWINVVNLKEGDGGSMIYNMVANYAYNNDKVFIGDPDDLSIPAFHRRLENMLSSALKFGTTRHLAPHPYQQGVFNKERPIKHPLNYFNTTGFIDWVTGDHKGNIDRMLTLSYNNLHEHFPTLSEYRFDPASNEFRSQSGGSPLTEAQLAGLAKRIRAEGSGEISAGVSTIKRALLTRFFRSAEETPRQYIDGWMAGLADESLQPSLKGVLYRRGAASVEGFVGRYGGEIGRRAYNDLAHVLKKGKNATKFLHQIAREAKENLPGIWNWYTSSLKAEAFRNKLRQTVEGIAATARNLSEAEFDEVNKLIADSTVQQKWAYNPGDIGRKAYIDSALSRRFKALKNPAQRQVIRDVFSHGEAMMKIKKQLATEAGIEDDLFTLKELNGPYAPLKRFGKYAAVLKSKEVTQAEADNDKNTLDKLKLDEKHYVVAFFDSKGSADKFARDNRVDYNEAYAFERTSLLSETRAPDHKVISKVLGTMEAKAGGTVSPEIREHYRQIITELYYQSLDESNARMSGRKRKGVAGYNENLLRSFLDHSRAEASFIANMKYGAEISGAFVEAQQQAGDHRQHQDTINLVSAHYNDMLSFNPTPIQDRVAAVTTVWMLTTSIGYHLTNATQPIMATIPKLAADFGNYSGAWGAWYKAYRVAKNVVHFEFKKMQTSIDIKKAPEHLQGLLREVQLMGVLDVGQEEDLSGFNRTTTGYKYIDATTGAFSTATHKLYQVARAVEAYNRVITAVAAHDLATSNPGVMKAKKTDVNEYAINMVQDTQGNFSRADSPLILKKLPKVTGQYRKYQLMMAWLYSNAYSNAFQNESPEIRAMGRRMLGYKLFHAGMASGAMGLPFTPLIGMLAEMMMGDEDEPWDNEREARKFIGNEDLADLLLKGPIGYITGLEVAAKLNEDTIFTVAPYTDYDLSSKEGLAKTAFELAAGPSGAVFSRWADGFGYMSQGDSYKAIENLAPKGLRLPMEAYRLSTNGYTTRAGDVISEPEDLASVWMAAYALGIPTQDIKDVKWTRSQQYQIEEFYRDKSKEIRHRYTAAARSNNRVEMLELRKMWVDLQNGKDKVRKFFNDSPKALRKQSISTLVKSPYEQRKRERETQRRM